MTFCWCFPVTFEWVPIIGHSFFFWTTVAIYVIIIFYVCCSSISISWQNVVGGSSSGTSRVAWLLGCFSHIFDVLDSVLSQPPDVQLNSLLQILFFLLLAFLQQQVDESRDENLGEFIDGNEWDPQVHSHIATNDAEQLQTLQVRRTVRKPFIEKYKTKGGP